MELEKLTEEAIHVIRRSGKKIICYVKVPDYIRQMEKQFRIAEELAFIVDEHERNWGRISILGREADVCPPDVLEKIDSDRYVFVITSEWFWEVFAKLKQNPVISNSRVFLQLHSIC